MVETDRKQRFIGRLKRLLDMAIAECSLKASLELGRLISVMENRSVPTMELPTLGSRLPNPLTVSMSRSRLFLGGLLSSSEVPDRCSGQSGKEHWSSLKMPQASAVKTAGSLVPIKPDLQCGSGPRAQYSDDFRSPRLRRISFGRLLSLHGPGDALGRAERNKPKKRAKAVNLPIMEPNAAGVDIGTTQIFVAVPPERDADPVRCFHTFTDDLEKLADWLQQCQVQTIAWESTGVYWIPLFQILEKRKIEVRLVNAHHVRNVPGKKTDVEDCQWIQH